MKKEIKEIQSSKKDIRKFAFILSVVAALWGTIFIFRKNPGGFYFFSASLFLLISGVFCPVILKPFYMAAAILTVFWRWVVSKIMIYSIFFLGFAPLNYIAKLFGKKFLELKFDKKADSYWIPREKGEYKQKNDERQF